MEATKILNASFLDILFDGRNKEYGAYHLRKTYNKRIWLALAITAGVAVILFIYFFVAQSLKGEQPVSFEINGLVIEPIPQETDKETDPPPPTPPKNLQTQKVEAIKFTSPPRIVDDKDVKKEDVPPVVTDLKETMIDVASRDGIKDLGIATPPVVDNNKMVVEAPRQTEEDKTIFTAVEVEASFTGGPDAWRRHLQKTLNPNTPIDNEAPPGTYTVIVQFIVDKGGNISDVKALTNFGYGMEEEAIRAIKRGPKWTPAIQNGRNVNAYRKQPITFIVPEE